MLTCFVYVELCVALQRTAIDEVRCYKPATRASVSVDFVHVTIVSSNHTPTSRIDHTREAVVSGVVLGGMGGRLARISIGKERHCR